MPKVKWLAKPEEHDYPAAGSYLRLVMTDAQVAAVLAEYRRLTVVQQKAKDILRASRLELLPATNAHVASDLAKVKAKTPLSPILLVRGRAGLGIATQIADGYHRVCASYLTDENTDIPCLIADLTRS